MLDAGWKAAGRMWMRMNRETWLPWIDLAICTGCGDCIAICPTGALGFHAEKVAVVKPEVCTYSARCEAICPVGAIALPYEVIAESDLHD